VKGWPGISLLLEGDGALAGERLVESQDMPKIVCLDGGMESGLPSVIFAFRMPDGQLAVCQTSARALLVAATAIAARWPDVKESLRL